MRRDLFGAARALVLPTVALIASLVFAPGRLSSAFGSTRSSSAARSWSSSVAPFGAPIPTRARSASRRRARRGGCPRPASRDRARGRPRRRGLVRPPLSARPAPAHCRGGSVQLPAAGLARPTSPRAHARCSATRPGSSSAPIARPRRPSAGGVTQGRARARRRRRWKPSDGARRRSRSCSEQVLDEVERAVVGKRDALELVLLGLPRRRPRADRGLPGPRQDADRALVRPGRWACASRASSSRPT